MSTRDWTSRWTERQPDRSVDEKGKGKAIAVQALRVPGG